jgi:hypothetical protein
MGLGAWPTLAWTCGLPAGPDGRPRVPSRAQQSKRVRAAARADRARVHSGRPARASAVRVWEAALPHRSAPGPAQPRALAGWSPRRRGRAAGRESRHARRRQSEARAHPARHRPTHGSPRNRVRGLTPTRRADRARQWLRRHGERPPAHSGRGCASGGSGWSDPATVRPGCSPGTSGRLEPVKDLRSYEATDRA